MKNKIFKSTAGQKAILEVYDSILARWPVPYQELNISTCLGNTFIIDSGAESSPSLILLHGSASNAMMWIGDIIEFSARFRVYAIDIPGEPGKSAAQRADLRDEHYANWLQEIITALSIERASLIGISLGGWLSLKYATSHPEHIESLVLLCPSGVALQKSSFLPLAIFFSMMGDWGQKRLFQIINGNTPIAEEAMRFTKIFSINFNPRMETIPLFSDEELRRLQMPTLLIAGKRDALLPSVKTASRLEKILPHFTKILLPDAGHVLVNQAGIILPFLTRQD